MRIPHLSLVLAFGALLLAGCTGSSKEGGLTGGGGKGGSFTVGVVFDSGGLGDKSFNDSANAGLERAKKELGITVKPVSSQTARDYSTNLDALASGDCQLVIAVGLNEGDALKDIAKKYPKVHFAIVDGFVDAPNVRSLDFAEEQGSFLAGFVAGSVSKSHTIGFVGGQELDLIRKFYTGYAAGALTANPATNVLAPKYVGNWENVDTAHADALQLFGSGADIVYHAAGRAGGGVIKAAEEQGKFAIGVDSDQDYLSKGHVLTSMIKHVDEAVFATVKDEKDGKFSPGQKIYDLAANGVGLSEMTFTKDVVGANVLSAVDDVRKKIISGEIKVPSTPEQLDTFKASLKK
jgi:basic membrane protein A